jgi:long-chain fatty acid transport protein
VKTEFQLPDVLSFGVGYQLMDAWYLEVDVDLTLWSSFEEIPIIFPDDTTGSLSSAIPQDWRDSITARLGNEIILGERKEWAIRFGGGFDQTPATSKYLSPMLPDSDRIFGSLGGGYEFDFGLALDIAYLYTYFLPREVDGHPLTSGDYDAAGNVPWSGNSFPARYTNVVHLIALTISQSF